VDRAHERLSVQDASARILDGVHALGAERVPLREALGRVLAEDAVSRVTLPPWASSAMDGYAVHGADVARATREQPVSLAVVETIAAGTAPTRRIGAGEAARIMTGAPVPEECDSVIRVEDTDDGRTQVRILDTRDVGHNVRPLGEDLRAGDAVLAAGAELGPAQIGVLASIGMPSVRVVRRPRVAIVGSGDELVDLDRFDEVLAGRRIVSTNSYTLEALVRECGGEPIVMGVAADTPEAVRELLRSAAASSCDLLLTSAGVSVGEHDHTRGALVALGVQPSIWRVRMRPGAPLGFGMLPAGSSRPLPWIGLPGNPVSAMVTFELFVRPALRRMLGHTRLFRRAIPVVLDEPVSTAAALTHFLRVVLRADDDGRTHARLTGPQGSGLLTSMARADALLVVPEDRRGADAGETLRAIVLRDDAFGTARLAL
jgi:molybdopterin molybdotransferase